jgi:hypothetical protein
MRDLWVSGKRNVLSYSTLSRKPIAALPLFQAGKNREMSAALSMSITRRLFSSFASQKRICLTGNPMGGKITLASDATR